MAASPIPPGMSTITPHLAVRGAAQAMDFYKKAFGAVEVMRMPGPDGQSVAHGEMKIGNSIFFIADEWPGMELAAPQKFGGTTVSIHLYVENCDALYNQAVGAGCNATMPLMNMFWGDRFGKVTDPFGHSWSIATHIENVSPAEMAKRGAEAMKNMGKSC
jgi:PhnB protein